MGGLIVENLSLGISPGPPRGNFPVVEARVPGKFVKPMGTERASVVRFNLSHPTPI